MTKVRLWSRSSEGQPEQIDCTLLGRLGQMNLRDVDVVQVRITLPGWKHTYRAGGREGLDSRS